ncbi:DUF732 domain-containing protein [Mycobacterium talmoniae]|nr:MULTISPECIES: DUF732 domain-containing protein [Mycobacterium]OHU92372.1 hypothetical protein BKN37_24985 [Mycobacterium talmoniae]
MGPLLAGLMAGPIATAVLLAAPAQADWHDDLYLDMLTHGEVNYGDPAAAIATGHSICSMYAQGKKQSDAATSLVTNKGMDYATAYLYVAAATVYCPDASNAAGPNGA